MMYYRNEEWGSLTQKGGGQILGLELKNEITEHPIRDIGLN